MNTQGHIDASLKAVEEIRERDLSTEEANLATGVYNQLIGLRVEWAEDPDPESADEFLSDTVDMIDAQRPGEIADELHARIWRLVEYVNFINAYGMEHDT